MSKGIMSALIASSLLAPAMPVYSQATALADTLLANQLDEVNDVLTDVSDIVNQSMNSIEIENKPQVEEVTYVYYEAPVYTPVIYYETVSVEHQPVIQSVDNALVEENVPNEAYQIALANYEDALAAYNAACELVETTKEVDVEVTEEVEDEEGNVTTVTKTEIQTITETSYAGDVDAAKAALDAAAAVLEQTPQFLTEIKEEVAQEESVIVSSEEAVSETALNAAADNQCGDDATWTLSSMGELKISGTGAIYDYTNSDHAPWFSQKLMVNTVTIESGITRIGNYAFDQCDRITSVIIGDTVTEIGKYAFNRNFALTEVVIPDSVTYIDNYAFNWCNNVKTVELGTGLVTISTQAFYECEALETIVIPSNVKTIGNGAFKECVSLRSITLNEGLQKIGASVFSGCISLTSIDIPSTVTSIGNNIFAACASLMSINVDNQNTNYSSLDGVLYNKSKTTLIQCPIGKSSISIPESVTEIGDSAFYECNLPSIKLPENVTSIGTHAFYRCRALTEMILPDSLTILGTSAFSMCRNLATVDLGNTLTAIPDSAFLSCDKLTTIILPNTLTSIAANAFDSCKALKDVYFEGTSKEWAQKSLFEFGPDVTIHFTKVIPFTDVPTDAWYYNVAKECYETGLISGTSSTTFSPMQTMTRAMVVTILWRMEGTPQTEFNDKFADVSSNRWYATAISWAVESGVVHGYGDGTFKPDTAVTREQVAVILANYVAYKEFYTPGTKDITTYPDGNQVSSWAVNGVKWAVTEGIVSGNGAGYLNPKKSATRAEGAAMLLRLDHWISQKNYEEDGSWLPEIPNIN